MSALSGLAAGQIPTNALGPADVFFRGMGFVGSSLFVSGTVGPNCNGSVRVNNDGSVSHSIGAAIDHYVSGLPLSATDLLCTEAAAPAFYNQGVGFTATGRVAVS
jgi:hypothetical protein